MRLFETIRVALAALRVNLPRALLTVLGMVIGVAAVIAMIALGNGTQAAVNERIARLGTNVLQVNAQRVNQGGVSTANTAKLTVNSSSILLAFGFATATGLVFGVWPARRAASLDPIEALRFD